MQLVTIDKEAVGEQVLEAIRDLDIGKEIEDAINYVLITTSSLGIKMSLRRSIKRTVNNELHAVINETLTNNTAFRDRIRELVKEQTTDDALRGIITAVFDRAINE